MHTNPLFKTLKVAKLDDLYKLQIALLTILFSLNETIHTHHTRDRQNPHVLQRSISITSKILRHKSSAKCYLIPKEITSKNN